MKHVIKKVRSQIIKPVRRRLDYSKRNSTGLLANPCKCSLCGKIFENKNATIEHAKKHTGEKPFQCLMCSKFFSQIYTLNLHVKTIHYKEGQSHKCSVCGKTYSRKQNLRIHERIHTGERPYKCYLCENSFIDSCALSIHILKNHPNEKPHKCLKCEESFRVLSSLKRHMKTHTREKCKKNSCDAKNTFTKESNIIDDKESQQEGNVQEKFSTSKYTIKPSHSFILNLRPHKCLLCKKSFKKLYHLERHWLTHTTGQNLYEFGFENNSLEIIEIELLKS